MYLTLVSQKHQIWLQICLCWICLENLKKKIQKTMFKKAETWTGVTVVINSLHVLVWLNNRKIRTIQIQYRHTHYTKAVTSKQYTSTMYDTHGTTFIPQHDIHPSTQVHNHHFYRTPICCTNLQQPQHSRNLTYREEHVTTLEDHLWLFTQWQFEVMLKIIGKRAQFLNDLL